MSDAPTHDEDDDEIPEDPDMPDDEGDADDE